MPDSTRIAATDSPLFDGTQLPRFFDAEQLAAQGITKKDLVANAHWFGSASEYRKILEVAKTETRNDESCALTLGTTEAGDRYKDRANITVRIPSQWPAHAWIAELLRGATSFDRATIKRCNTMAMQLELLKQLPGWEDVNSTGTVNESFGERLSNALELIYFGVNAQKVLVPISMRATSGFSSRYSLRGQVTYWERTLAEMLVQTFGT
jgi:hypothetical protein